MTKPLERVGIIKLGIILFPLLLSVPWLPWLFLGRERLKKKSLPGNIVKSQGTEMHNSSCKYASDFHQKKIKKYQLFF